MSLTEALVQRASVTPNDEGCQALISDLLRSAGFEVSSLPFDDVDNLWAVHGNEGPMLVFAGHTDVVPAGEESDWNTPPFSPVVRDGVLYGRGTADMKGSLASMVLAGVDFVKEYPAHKGRIAYLITSDEEGIAINGTRAVVDWLRQNKIRPDWCIVGEPSSSDQAGDTIKNGRRGSTGATLKIKGVQGHVAYPHLAKNPIHLVLPFLSELVEYEWDQGNEHFPATSLQITKVNADGKATNVIPGNLEILFNLRFSTEHTPESIHRQVKTMLDASGLDYDIEWWVSGLPFLTKESPMLSALEQAISSVTGLSPKLSTAGGTSDGRFIAQLGTDVVELGPVNKTIHQVNECVSVQALTDLHLIHLAILEDLFKN